MQELTLALSERAKSRLAEMGHEFEIVVGSLGTGAAARHLPMVRLGAPAEADRGAYTALEQDGITVWAPDSLMFVRNTVAIDMHGIAGMVLPLAVSAIVDQPSECSSCASCGGGCAGCRE